MPQKIVTNGLTVLFSVSFALFLFSCSSSRQTRLTASEISELDAKVFAQNWRLPEAPEQYLPPRTWNIHHQRLWLQFDFEQEKVVGKTEITLTSLRNGNHDVRLDSRSTKMDSVISLTNNLALTFEQDSVSVRILLPEAKNRDDSLVVRMYYESSPNGRGLYFVNPGNRDPAIPTQIFTLGKPDDNAFWFPSIHHPAERFTQELWITVPERFQTISNGNLVSQSKLAGDSLRTDYWQTTRSHPPYLVGLAVGEFHSAKRVLPDLTLQLYTESRFSEFSDIIFDGLEEQLAFMSNKTGVPYPWDPVFRIAPVRNFPVSSVEHTTAALVFDGVQFSNRGAKDLSNQDLFMRLVAQHWFGNLVSPLNWSNLPLSEGFAAYFGWLYRAEKQGFEDVQQKVLESRKNYFREAHHFRRPVISSRYHYPEDLFDRHTYDKTALILRMLHHYLEDDIWWAAIHHWLRQYAFQAVSLSELQRVFEQESGQSLQWFFRPWFLEPGHPEIEISARLGERSTVRIRQVHNQEIQPVYRLPMPISFVFDDEIQNKTIWVDRPDSHYVFHFDRIPSDVILDPDRILLAQYRSFGSYEQHLARLSHPSLAIRLEALHYFNQTGLHSELLPSILNLAQHDASPIVRLVATELLENFEHEDVQLFAESRTFENEPEGRIRLASLYLMESAPKIRKLDHYRKLMQDPSYFVQSEAIIMFAKSFPEQVCETILPFFEEESWQDVVRGAVVRGLSYATTEPCSFDFLRDVATLFGTQAYIQEAIAVLPLFSHVPGARSAAIDVYVHRLNFEIYPNNRVLIYEALADLQAKEAVSDLEKLYQTGVLAPAEKEVLELTIKALQGYHE